MWLCITNRKTNHERFEEDRNKLAIGYRLSAIGYRLILGVLVSVFAATAFAADCKVNDSDLSGEYVGGCVNGLAQGRGKAKGRDTYEGEFKAGNKHGRGIYTWANGDKYEGDYLDDRRNGKGAYVYSSGTKYVGEYKNSKEHGFGKLTVRRENTKTLESWNGVGNWIGDVYVVEGIFDGNILTMSCTSLQNCKQEQAKRETQERREAADREASTRQACSRLYIGKPVSWPEGRTCVLTGCDNFTLHGQIVGVGNGVASAKVTESYKYGQVHEKACNEF